jgi:hypothetical protein
MKLSLKTQDTTYPVVFKLQKSGTVYVNDAGYPDYVEGKPMAQDGKLWNHWEDLDLIVSSSPETFRADCEKWLADRANRLIKI